MTDIHFVQVTGKMEAEKMVEGLEECGMSSDDNIIVTDQQVNPLQREEALFFLEEIANALDVAEEMNIDWEEEYTNQGIVK